MKRWRILAQMAGLMIFAAISCQQSPRLPAIDPPATAPAATAPDEKARLTNFLGHPIHFQKVCFRGEEFPACEYDQPDQVRALIGPYSLKRTFYDAQGVSVETAKNPGRYAAVVEITYAARTTKRFVTLCRIAGQAADVSAPTTQPSELLHAGIDGDILKDRAGELPQRVAPEYDLYTPWESTDAILAAGLYDLTALKKSGQALPTDSLVNLDRQWWVAFKRRFYGYDKRYPNEFICPRPVEGPPAPTIHWGAVRDAGMAPDTLGRINQECQDWVKESGQGMSLCVVRHGVVVVQKAYGVRTRGSFKGQPFAVDTVCDLASVTKFLSGMLIAEFADQGLVHFDDPADKYVATLRGLKNPNPPTLRNLYLHNAGFDDHWGDLVNDLEEEIADLYPTLRADSVHKYQGTGHALGGKIMEMISGQSIPRLFGKHLFEPLGCGHMRCDGTSYLAWGTSVDLATMGQMMLNGGVYGKLRFTSPRVIQQMQPIPGHDRFDPDKTIRWGVGIKMFDSDHFSEKAYGGSGMYGAFLKIDPTYDLVVAMVRDNEGDRYLQRRGQLVRLIINCIEP
jgi:CubicO group peptidase (beta-lactamase class C family)